MATIRDGAVYYGIIKNHLQTGQYNAKVIHQQRVKGITELVADINKSTLVSEVTCLQVINALAKSMEEFLKDGYIVQVPGLLNARLQLSVPPNLTDHNYVITTDNARLTIDARMPQSVLESIQSRVVYEKRPIPEKVPIIEDVELLNHPGTHNAITSDTHNTIRITGGNLEFDHTDPLQGVFMRTVQGEEIRVVTAPYKMTERFIETMGVIVNARGGDPLVTNYPVTLIIRTKYTENGSLREGVYSTPIVDYDSL